MSARDTLAKRIAARHSRHEAALTPVGESYMVRAPDEREALRIAWRLALGDGFSPSVLHALHVIQLSRDTWEVIMRTGFQEDDDR